MVRAIEREASYIELGSRVSAAQAGDADALGSLFREFQRTVYATALGVLGNPDDALELQQDVFIHVMKRLPQLREPERFAGWLRRMTHRMALNVTTRSSWRRCRGSLDLFEPVQADSQHHKLEEEERSGLLHNLLEEQRELDGQITDLFYFQGLSLLEIAAALDIPLGTVKRRLHTARERLRQAAEEAGMTTIFHDPEVGSGTRRTRHGRALQTA
jgi:RNA polymerase sigma-70 factor (ECF subfamily)